MGSSSGVAVVDRVVEHDDVEVATVSDDDGRRSINQCQAHLYLAAVGEANNVVAIPERGSFSLPIDPDAAQKPYVFKEVNDAGQVVIEYQAGGETESVMLTPDEGGK